MSALSLAHTTRPRLGHLRQDELAELFSTLATADINALAAINGMVDYSHRLQHNIYHVLFYSR